MNEYHVIVKFGTAIPSEVQGRMLLWFERELRTIGIPAEVFKEVKEDDNKRRRLMTVEERSNL